MINHCEIIGVLDNGPESLSTPTLEIIENADVVIAATRVLTLFSEYILTTETKDLTGYIKKVPRWVEKAFTEQKQVVVLATGDPLCYGIGNFLTKILGVDKVRIIPNVSTIQLAFARIGIPWQNTKFCSVHTQDLGEWQHGSDESHGLYTLLQAIYAHDKLAILTSPSNDPSRIARMMLLEGIADAFTIVVAEDLLCPHEKVFQDFSISELAEQSFTGNAVVLLFRKTAKPPTVLLGYPDHSFKQRKPDKGLITKLEVRAVSLARMQLTVNSLVWDIGAGSGSVGIEAAKLCSAGHVYAIEKNSADFAIADENSRHFGLYNYTLIENKAPVGMEDWPAPNAIFIGGSGGELAKLIKLCLKKLQTHGYLVMNFVTLENLNTALETLKQSTASWDITQLQASRSHPILQMHRMRAENAVWIVTAQKLNT